MPEKPDYVASYQKPPNTEIKYINGHWYLYSRINYWDPTRGKSWKKSGAIIGKLTPDGLVPSKHRGATASSVPLTDPPASGSGSTDGLETAPSGESVGSIRSGNQQSAPHSRPLSPTSSAPGVCLPEKDMEIRDTVEVGATLYLISRTEAIRVNLQEFFPDYWLLIYTVCLVRTVYGCPLSMVPFYFNHCILPYIYPEVTLSSRVYFTSTDVWRRTPNIAC